MAEPDTHALHRQPTEKGHTDAIEEAVSRDHTLAYGGDDTLPAPPILSVQEERRLWRRIDARLVPMTSILYLCSFVDRSNIGNAKLQGLLTQLDLDGNKYNIALTLYFVSFDVFAIFANLLTKKARPSRWLSSITVVWGLITALTGLVRTYHQLVAVRILLGIAECGLACGTYLLFSFWYPGNMIQARVGIFLAGATCAGAFSGLLAYAISFISGRGGLLGWSWLFIIEGSTTVMVGCIAFFVLVDLPDTATFLTPEERAYVIHRKKRDNSSVGEEESFEWRHVRSALLDWQVWSVSFIYVTICVPIYGISLFLPSIINGFGFGSAIAQLLTVPQYFVATVVVMWWAVWADRSKMRSPFIVMGLLLSAIGYGISLSNASVGVKYFATFLIAIGGYASVPAVIAWMQNNVVWHYKRAVAIALQCAFGNFGGIIVSNVYRVRDAPEYRFGHAMALLFIGLGLVVTPLTAYVYMRLNARRDELQREADTSGIKYSPEELRRLGDRAPDFRYTL